MPKHSRVHQGYDALRRRGASSASAARIAQAQTGLALATGLPPIRYGGSADARDLSQSLEEIERRRKRRAKMR